MPGAPLLHSPLLALNPRLHLALQLRLPCSSLGRRGVCLGSLALPSWGGWGKPPPGRLAGLLLADTGLGPCPMGPSAIGTLDRCMWTAVLFSHPTPLDGAPVVSRLVVLRTDGTPGGHGLAIGGDVPPLAALAAKGTWPSRLLKGIDLAPLSEESGATLAQASTGRLAENSHHH